VVIGGKYGDQTYYKSQHVPRKNGLGQLVQDMWEVDVREHGEEGDQICAQDRMPAFDSESVVELRSTENEIRRDEVVGGSHGYHADEHEPSANVAEASRPAGRSKNCYPAVLAASKWVPGTWSEHSQQSEQSSHLRTTHLSH
jgi:hypothetical protein